MEYSTRLVMLRLSSRVGLLPRKTSTRKTNRSTKLAVTLLSKLWRLLCHTRLSITSPLYSWRSKTLRQLSVMSSCRSMGWCRLQTTVSPQFYFLSYKCLLYAIQISKARRVVQWVVLSTTTVRSRVKAGDSQPHRQYKMEATHFLKTLIAQMVVSPSQKT